MACPCGKNTLRIAAGDLLNCGLTIIGIPGGNLLCIAVSIWKPRPVAIVCPNYFWKNAISPAPHAPLSGAFPFCHPPLTSPPPPISLQLCLSICLSLSLSLPTEALWGRDHHGHDSQHSRRGPLLLPVSINCSLSVLRLYTGGPGIKSNPGQKKEEREREGYCAVGSPVPIL